MRVTILGCGSSGGVPRIGNDWGACDPHNPKNRRRRCSVLVEHEETCVVIDTAPDFREQMLDADVQRLDAVVFTHAHADQAHGIDDLRMFYLRQRALVPVYGNAETIATLHQRFDYCFAEVAGYPPILAAHELKGPQRVGSLDVVPFTVEHGQIEALGFRIGRFGYVPDVSGLPEAAMAELTGLDTLVLDALRYRPHPSHAHLEQALEWIEVLRPRRAVLTNLHIDLDYETLVAEVPDGVEPAYDRMVLDIPCVAI